MLDVLQQEKDQPCAHVKDLQKCLHAERKLISHSRACHKAKKEQFAQAQSEGTLLQQQVEEAPKHFLQRSMLRQKLRNRSPLNVRIEIN